MAIALREGRRLRSAEVVIVRPDGSRVHVLENSDPILGEDGGIAGAVSAFIDVTGRHGAQTALRQRDEWLWAVLDELFAFVGILDADGTLLEANRPPLARAGLTIDAVRGRKFWDCHWWDYDAGAVRQLRFACARAAAGELVRYDATVRMVEPERIVIDFMVAPIADAMGRVTHLVACGVDIDERKRTEAALRERTQRYELVLAGARDALWDWDVVHGRVQYSVQWKTLHGYAADEPREGVELWRESIHPDDRERVVAAVQAHFDGATPVFSEEYRIVCADGSEKWIADRGLAQRDATGRVLRMAGSETDITQRKQAEQELRQKAEELEQLMNLAPVAIWKSHDPLCEHITGNRMANRLYEADAEENVSAGPASSDHTEGPRRFFRPDGRELCAAELPMQRAVAHNVEVHNEELIAVSPSGRRIALLGSATPLRDEGGDVRGCLAAFLDVSEREAMNAALRESEARLRTLADNISQLAWMADASGAVFWYNRRWFDYTGARPEGMLGLGWRDVCHPQHLARVEAKFREHLASGEPWEDTFPLCAADGSYRWFLSRAVPIRDESGRVIRWFGTNTDITEHQATEEALRQADRRKDRFLAMLAHELRNPLAPIRNAVQVLDAIGSQLPQARRSRDAIERQVAHMSRIIDDLLDVSRIARDKIELRREAVDLCQVVRHALEDEAPPLDRAGLVLRAQVPAEPLWVEGDRVRLAQVVGNLLANAEKFTERGGTVEVSLAREDGAAVLEVADDGIGMDAATLARLFEPFAQADQTLSRSRGGLGLGLALVKGLVALHGGSVEARSEGPGRGARFLVRLPLAAAPDLRPAQRPAGRAEANSPLRILIIEDHRDTAESLQMLLELDGYAVRVAYDGGPGIAAAREYHPDVVICDIGLPGMDGYQVAERLRQEVAGRSALLIAQSGYGQREDIERAHRAGFDRHLTKPIDVEGLRALLAGARRGASWS
jgi:PAS domain S-box-containing protein